MDYQDVLLSPHQYFDYLKQKGDFPSSQKLPKTVLIVYQKAVLSHLLNQYPHYKGKSFLSKMSFFDTLPVAVCGGFGIGAPALAIKLEELIAWGVKRFVSIGTACVLTSEIPVHSLVMAQKVLGVDGVSKHYGDLKAGIEVDVGLKQLLSSYAMKEGVFPRPVTAMSTDLFFGTTRRDVDDFQSRQAEVLDMESAAFYAIAKKREVEALSLFVTSDSLATDEWTPGFDSEATADELKKAADFAFRFCIECS